MSRVLVVDDEAPMRRALAVNLRARGYEPELAADGEEALRLAAEHKPDAVLLDLGLPGMSGIEVIVELRTTSDVPIVVLSARGAERDKVVALDAGADDYVTKPFGMDELFARLRASLRRVVADEAVRIVETPDFVVDLDATRVTRGDTEVRLTPIEWRLVEALVAQTGKLVSHAQLLQEVWGPGYHDESNYLRVHFAHIRAKLEPDRSRPRYFITEPGMGYRFENPASTIPAD
ncbi:MAG: response regulator transcription factor [Actinobacteria bacterium]|nr:response regulator transcription factor [Actinomycetota bacterium]